MLPWQPAVLLHKVLQQRDHLVQRRRPYALVPMPAWQRCADVFNLLLSQHATPPLLR
jgi:hypothetical protein